MLQMLSTRGRPGRVASIRFLIVVSLAVGTTPSFTMHAATHAGPAHPGPASSASARPAPAHPASAPPASATPDPSVHPAFEPLAWLVGEWQAEFHPREGLAAPTMAFAWGDDNRSFLRMTGTTPTPDGLRPEYESMVVWDPTQSKHVFLGVYRNSGGRVTEDGEIELLPDGAVRLHMNVHYPEGSTAAFSDGRAAGPEGHTLHFRRTLHRAGPDAIRGTFRIQRDGEWVDPHPDVTPEGGYPWRRISATGTDRRSAASQPTAATITPAPDWVQDHWTQMIGRWVADNSAYRSDQETADAYVIEWSWGVGRSSMRGRMFALDGGEETQTIWEFREFWHPGRAELLVEQWGAGGVYGSGPQTRLEDGTMEMEQVFHYPAAGASARVGHRARVEGDRHTTESFDVGEDGEWKARRRYVWVRERQTGE